MPALSNEELKVLFRSIPALYLVLNPELEILDASEEYLNATLTRLESIRGRNLFEAFPDNPGDPRASGVANLRASLYYVLTHRKPHTMAVQRYDIRRPDGTFEERYWSPVNKPVMDELGNIRFIIHRVEDVTDFVRYRTQTQMEKEAELYNRAAELQRINASLLTEIRNREVAEEKFRNLLEHAPDAKVVVNQAGRIELVNRRAEMLFGYDRHQLLGQPLEILIPAEIRARYSGYFLHYLKQPQVRNKAMGKELQALRRDGERVPVEISLSPLITGEGLLVLVAIRDITERKKLQDKLRRFNRDLEAQVQAKTAELTGIFERITDGFIALDRNFCYTYANQRIGELTRQDPRQLIGKNVWEIFPEAVGSATWKAFHQALEEQRYLVQEDYYAPLDLWQENHIYPSVDGLSVFIRDITERKKSEQQLRHYAEELKLLASHLLHVREEERIRISREIHDELGQQLTVIKMDLVWLQKRLTPKGGEPAEKIQDLLNMVNETVRTVRRIASELRPGILDDLGLVAAVEWHLREMEKRTEIRMELMAPDSEPPLPTEIKTGLFRILQESLTNVARHSGASRVQVNLAFSARQVHLEITDNGRGYEAGDQAKRTLGILGMQERTSALGGEYSIVGKPGQGTTVRVVVPLPSADLTNR
ncbi:MAG TPA: PAS domain S-box protein [Chitinophagaceae bacterium]|nr:PAS domain S-box protein [Chitinophagaceae bacterium]